MGTAEKAELSKIIKYFFCLICSLIAFWVVGLGLAGDSQGLVANAETISSEFAISTSPSSGFIKAPKMAPGDKVTATLWVYNDGEYDFAFDVSAQKEGGDDKIYNVLDLVITDSEGELYAGKLKDCQNSLPRIIGCGGARPLIFTVGLPVDCDNTYQGLPAGVTFVFTATEHPPSVPGGAICWDPPLEKSDVFVRQGMKMPIKFHLLQNGTFDTVKRGVDLLITGIYNGRPVTYKFSVVDGMGGPRTE